MASLGGPNIVTSGLVLSLDAANVKSYPGSGTTWRDLSGNSNNGTLTNGPTFSSANGGSIVFDGTNDYVITGATTLNLSTNANFTHCTWIYPSFASNSNNGVAIIDSTGPGPSYLRSYLRWENSSLGFYYDIADSGGGSGWRTATVPVFSANTWHFTCFAHDNSNNGTFYFDGNTVNTTRLFNNPKTVINNPVTIGYGAVNSYYWRGNIANVQIYNRALSATEILQNYNATQARFNL